MVQNALCGFSYKLAKLKLKLFPYFDQNVNFHLENLEVVTLLLHCNNNVTLISPNLLTTAYIKIG